MAQTISRTLKNTKVVIKSSTGELIKEFVANKKTTKVKESMAYMKETGCTNFAVELVEIEEQREMTLDTFIANSTLVKKA